MTDGVEAATQRSPEGVLQLKAGSTATPEAVKHCLQDTGRHQRVASRATILVNGSTVCLANFYNAVLELGGPDQVGGPPCVVLSGLCVCQALSPAIRRELLEELNLPPAAVGRLQCPSAVASAASLVWASEFQDRIVKVSQADGVPVDQSLPPGYREDRTARVAILPVILEAVIGQREYHQPG
jgi:hypothetical protein